MCRGYVSRKAGRAGMVNTACRGVPACHRTGALKGGIALAAPEIAVIDSFQGRNLEIANNA